MTASLSTRWGLLGAGWIARRSIAPAIHSADGATLQAVGARDAARAARLSPQGRAYSDYQAVIDDPKVDAVYIALSNDGHLPWAAAAARAGKAVLCEKPLGCNAAEAEQMRATSEACGTLLVEATWNLWHPRTRRASALLASDTIGSLTAMAGSFVFDGVAEGNYRLDPQLGGGALLDVGCYPMTAATWATDARRQPSRDDDVHEATAVMSGTGVDLTCDARLSMSGADVRVRGSFIEPPAQTLVLTGEHGRIEFTGDDAYTSWLRPSSLTVLDRDGERIEQFAPTDPYRLMIEHVSRAVRGQDAWLPDPRWSITVARSMDAVLAMTRAT